MMNAVETTVYWTIISYGIWLIVVTVMRRMIWPLLITFWRRGVGQSWEVPYLLNRPLLPQTIAQDVSRTEFDSLYRPWHRVILVCQVGRGLNCIVRFCFLIVTNSVLFAVLATGGAFTINQLQRIIQLLVTVTCITYIVEKITLHLIRGPQKHQVYRFTVTSWVNQDSDQESGLLQSISSDSWSLLKQRLIHMSQPN